MVRNLKRRLERIEQRRPTATERLPQQLWHALSEVIPEEQLDPDTRLLVEKLYRAADEPVIPEEQLDPDTRLLVEKLYRAADEPDYVEEYLAAVAADQLREGDDFASFSARRKAEFEASMD